MEVSLQFLIGWICAVSTSCLLVMRTVWFHLSVALGCGLTVTQLPLSVPYSYFVV